MKVEFKGNKLNAEEREQVWEILCECDDEFYPRLSLRNSSSQKNLRSWQDNSDEASKPITYFEEMIKQDFLLAYEDGRVVGFMTFKQHYICEALQNFGESLYITTVCVKKELRGKGIMKAMYEYMESQIPQICDCSKISTRTWSLNDAQIYELTKRGYDRLAVLENDRGNGVDTIYFGIET